MSRDGFLSRWSRRKAEVQDAPRPPVVLPPELRDDAPDPATVETKPEDISEEQRAAIVAELPDVETLDEESDFTGFLQNGVPEELQRLALRKLWRTNPVFANLDGMNDYDEDFSVIQPLAAGVAEELRKLMRDNAKHTTEDEETPQDTEAEDQIKTDDVHASSQKDEQNRTDLEDDHDVGSGEDERILPSSPTKGGE